MTTPTSCEPFNELYDVQRKTCLAKVTNQRVYIVQDTIVSFKKGWVKSFCLKLITLERYEYRGPFKTDIEMRRGVI